MKLFIINFHRALFNFLRLLLIKLSAKISADSTSGFKPSSLGTLYNIIDKISFKFKFFLYNKKYKPNVFLQKEYWSLQKKIILDKYLEIIFSKFNNDRYLNTTNSLSNEDVFEVNEELNHIKNIVILKLQEQTGVNFKLRSFNIIRTFPGSLKDAGPSYLWHHDYVSKFSYKIFIYGNKQDKLNGATTIFNKIDSNKIMIRGFNTIERDKSQCIIDAQISAKSIIVEGEKGDVLFWRNSLIHKGSLPFQGKRDLISFEVVPSYISVVNKPLKARKLNVLQTYKNIVAEIFKSI